MTPRRTFAPALIFFGICPTRVSKKKVPGQRKIGKFSSTASLARFLGLSRWTVSRALNGRGGVGDSTVRRVVETAARHGFAPSALGRGLRAGVTPFIGLCVPGIEDYSLSGKISMFQDLIGAQGLDPIFQITDGTRESEERALARFSAMRCRGLVTFASRIPPERVVRVAEGISNLVRVDPVVAPAAAGSISTDRSRAMAEAIGHLDSLGHRSACIAGIREGDAYAASRLAGLKTSASGAGWRERSLVCLDVEDREEDFAFGRALAGAYLTLGSRRPRAIVAVNDRVAFAMLMVLAEAGCVAPGDYSIVGYENTPLSKISSTPLTTIDPHAAELVAAAGHMLFATGLQRSRVIAPRLVVRESTGPPPVRC